MSPVEVAALIDTGSDVTCVEPSVTTRLDLFPVNWGFPKVPAGVGLALNAICEVELTIPHPTAPPSQWLVIPDLKVAERDLSGIGVEALIGRDVLVYCVLIYDGVAGTFTLSY